MQVSRKIIGWETLLSQSSPKLFAISLDQKKTMRKAFDDGIENLSFRRALVGTKRSMWADLKKLCENPTFWRNMILHPGC